MRGVLVGVFLFLLGLFADFFLEHTVNRAPKWVARAVAALFIPLAMVVVILSDPVWPHVYGVRADPLRAGLILTAALVIALGSFAWVFFHTRDEQATGKKSPHNLACIGTEVRRIYFGESGAISSRPVLPNDPGREAVVAVYANEPVRGGPLSAVRNVRATISHVISSAKLPGGWWLDEPDDTADFEPGAAVRELLLVYRDPDNSIWAVEDRREGIGRNIPPRHFAIFTRGHTMGALQVRVQLSARGHVINECSFFVDIADEYAFGADIVHQEQFQIGNSIGRVIEPDPSRAEMRERMARYRYRKANPEA